MNGSGSWKSVYDGIHLPEMPEEAPYVFKLQLAEATFTPDDPVQEQIVPLFLPATDNEILTVLEQLGAASLEECVFYHCESPIPALEQAFSFSEDINKMNLLAGRIRELENSGELPKLKAAFEIAGCTDIDQALDLARNLDCYDFYPELSSMDDYVKQDFMNRHRIPADDPALKFIHFSHADPNQMKDINICLTPYGIIRRAWKV